MLGIGTRPWSPVEVADLDAEDGRLATETRLARPFGIELDAEGDLYVMDTINSRILKVTK